MVFGRKQEASDRETGPLERPNPPLPHEDGRFRQVTDVAFDAAGNAYISDGYINSRVAKVDRNGRWLKSWGSKRSEEHTSELQSQSNLVCRLLLEKKKKKNKDKLIRTINDKNVVTHRHNT